MNDLRNPYYVADDTGQSIEDQVRERAWNDAIRTLTRFPWMDTDAVVGFTMSEPHVLAHKFGLWDQHAETVRDAVAAFRRAKPPTRPVFDRFTDRVRAGLDPYDYVSPGAAAGCDACGLGDMPYTVGLDDEGMRRIAEADAGSFMKRPCDVCKRPEDGHRHPAHAFLPIRPGAATAIAEHVHLDVCGDCLGYIANATIPDGLE